MIVAVACLYLFFLRMRIKLESQKTSEPLTGIKPRNLLITGQILNHRAIRSHMAE
jgi:hypothetical protein